MKRFRGTRISRGSEEDGELEDIRVGNINTSQWTGMPIVKDCFEGDEWLVQMGILGHSTASLTYKKNSIRGNRLG